MKPLISVVVPVYNVASYLEKCLDSILAQTFQDMEVIVVDDGATDGSGAICDRYARQDPRVRVIHQANGGLSAARNCGIEHASGTYIGFVDSDDYIAPDMYETLLGLLTSQRADIAMCALYDMYDGQPVKVNTTEQVMTVGREEAMKIVLEAEIVSVTAVNKLYRRSLFDTVRYPVGKTAEDAFVIIELLDLCDTVVITSAQKYYYIHRGNSITSRSFNPHTLDTIEAYRKNAALIERKYPQLRDTAEMRLCWAYFYVLDRLVYDTSPEYVQTRQEVVAFLRRRFAFIMKDRRFTPARKLSELMLMVSVRAYRACVDLQNRRYRIT